MSLNLTGNRISPTDLEAESIQNLERITGGPNELNAAPRNGQTFAFELSTVIDKFAVDEDRVFYLGIINCENLTLETLPFDELHGDATIASNQ